MTHNLPPFVSAERIVELLDDDRINVRSVKRTLNQRGCEGAKIGNVRFYPRADVLELLGVSPDEESADADAVADPVLQQEFSDHA